MKFARSTAALGLLAAGVTGLLAYKLTRTDAPLSRAVAEGPIATAPATYARPSAYRADGGPPPGIGNNRTVPGAKHPFPRVPRTRAGLSLEADPFVAESVEEQRWLDRNGYPNQKQLEAYTAASNYDLEAAVAAGDQVAAVTLASRKLPTGDAAAGAELMAHAAKGSSYALSLLAAYHAGSRNGNPSLAYSLLRLAELRGDWRAAFARSQMPFELDSMQRATAEAEALRMFREMQQNAGSRNVIDPRPVGC